MTADNSYNTFNQTVDIRARQESLLFQQQAMRRMIIRQENQTIMRSSCLKATTCCGLREFTGLLNTPKETLLKFCRSVFREPRGNGAFYIFSGTSSSVIDKLDKFINSNKLGRTYKTGYKRNPNSGNRLMVMIFEPNMKRLRLWYGNHSNSPVPNFGRDNDSSFKIFMVLFIILYAVPIIGLNYYAYIA